MSGFDERLRKLRKQSGFTQQQLATRLGVTKSVISYYELRERSPSPEILIKISEIFHVSTDYLLGIHTENTLDASGLDDDDLRVVQSMIHLLRQKNSHLK